jgi:hypothetical protein
MYAAFILGSSAHPSAARKVIYPNYNTRSRAASSRAAASRSSSQQIARRAGDCFADDEGNADTPDLTNRESVVWSDVAKGGLLGCGCRGFVDVPEALPEVVAVSGSGSVASTGDAVSDGGVGFFGACGVADRLKVNDDRGCKTAASWCASEPIEVSTVLQSSITSVMGSLIPTAVVSAAWAYGETVSTITKTVTATQRPYDEGIRPIIPCGYRCAPLVVGRRGTSALPYMINSSYRHRDISPIVFLAVPNPIELTLL